MRVLTEEIVNKEGESVELTGWVTTRRDHGKLIFIDLRDRSGIVQVVFLPKPEELRRLADKLRQEWVIKLTGKVSQRPKGMENQEIPTGSFEVQAEKLEILNHSETPPIAVDTDGYEIGEEARMKYRYLDLRRPRFQKNLKMRAKINKFIRDFLTKKNFIEIETPILGKSTPEGARDYLAPSRLQPGKFYALAQSPQQYKQLLMVACFERYFQIAKCFRDEDTRGDRQPEFTQLDLEMSFIEKEDILILMEEMAIALVKTIFPEKIISQIPFPKITHKEAMKKYGSDKPDLRKSASSGKNNPDELAFAWIIDFPVFEKDEKTGKLTYSHNPFTAPKPEFFNDLMNGKNFEKMISQQYDLALNGFEIAGGGIRINKPELLEKIFETLGHSKEDIKNNFGHMLESFNYGAPPHGGIAFGLDRIMAILLNEPNIREVIAFPKTGDGRDLMTQAPSEADRQQLDELGIKIK